MAKRVAHYKTIPVETIKQIIKNSTSFAEALNRIGTAGTGRTYTQFQAYIKKLNIPTNHFAKRAQSAYVFEHYFCENSLISRSSIKKKILKEKLIEYKCDSCGIRDKWNGANLVLILDHINGVNNDNRLENLRFLCPNCNSQTSTFCSKNVAYQNSNININLNPINTIKKIENRKKITKKEIIRELKKNNSLKATYSALSISVSALKYFCKKNNIDTGYYILRDCFALKICKQYNKNYNIHQLAKMYNTSIGNIRRILNKNKVLIKQNPYTSFSRNPGLKEKIPVRNTWQGCEQEEVIKELTEMLKFHRNLSAVGRVYGVSSNAVKKWCIKYKINYSSFFDLSWNSSYICKQYSSNISIATIAKELKTTEFTIRKILIANNISIRKTNFPMNLKTKNKIVKLIKQGMPLTKILSQENVPYSVLKRIKQELRK